MNIGRYYKPMGTIGVLKIKQYGDTFRKQFSGKKQSEVEFPLGQEKMIKGKRYLLIMVKWDSLTEEHRGGVITRTYEETSLYKSRHDLSEAVRFYRHANCRCNILGDRK